MSKATRRHREHAGPKHGGSGYYGQHQDAKRVSKKSRRAKDKVEIVEAETVEVEYVVSGIDAILLVRPDITLSELYAMGLTVRIKGAKDS